MKRIDEYRESDFSPVIAWAPLRGSGKQQNSGGTKLSTPVVSLPPHGLASERRPWSYSPPACWGLWGLLTEARRAAGGLYYDVRILCKRIDGTQEPRPQIAAAR